MFNTIDVRPRFSVVIPVRDDAEVISRCLAGVLAQTFANVEVVVVDSGSTDQSVEAVETIADERVRMLSSPKLDRDLTAARLHGVKSARGIWTILFEAGDEAEPGWLARMGRLIDATGAGFVSCGGVQSFADGSQTQIVPVDVPGRPGVRSCLRPGSFAAPTELFQRLDPLVHTDPVTLGLDLIDATLDAGRRVVFTPESLLRWNEPSPSLASDPAVDADSCDAMRLRWAIQAIDALARTPIPDGDLLARYATFGGKAAAKLGRKREARRLFGVARSAEPGDLEHWLRWAASCLPLASGRI